MELPNPLYSLLPTYACKLGVLLCSDLLLVRMGKILLLYWTRYQLGDCLGNTVAGLFDGILFFASL
jgi:hypothetical protein